MWIISKKHGVVNTDNVSAIEIIDWRNNEVHVYDSVHAFCITDGDGNYQKIIEAIKNHDDYVEVD